LAYDNPPSDDPPEGFLRIDFDRGRGEPAFNSHIGTLYASAGPGVRATNSSSAFACASTCAIPQAACMAA
jgi:hypothetical protein